MQEVPGSCESENTCEGAHEKCTMIPRSKFSHVTHTVPEYHFRVIPRSRFSHLTHTVPEYHFTVIPMSRFSHVTHILPGEDTFSLPDSYCVCSEVGKVWDLVHRIHKYSFCRKKCEEQKPPCKTESQEDCLKRQSQVRCLRKSRDIFDVQVCSNLPGCSGSPTKELVRKSKMDCTGRKSKKLRPHL